MAFRHACFLSYRHSSSRLGTRAVDEFERALNDELALLNHLTIFRDDRNKPGYLYQEVIATALCESVCMVMIFSPTYFAHEYPYCTREYHAMVMLEQKRLALLPASDRKFGLIIPVMIRGTLGHLPVELRDKRMHADFTEWALWSGPMYRHRKFAPRVKQIAEYIDERWRAFQRLTDDPCTECRNFALPSYDDVRRWLDEFLEQAPHVPWILGDRP